MKEAAGEANMTVITIVLIAIVLGIGTIIVNNVLDSTAKNAACTSSGGITYGGKCYVSSACDTSNGKTTCSGTTMTCSKNSNGEYTCQ